MRCKRVLRIQCHGRCHHAGLNGRAQCKARPEGQGAASSDLQQVCGGVCCVTPEFSYHVSLSKLLRNFSV